MGFNVTDELVIRFFSFVRYLRRNGSTRQHTYISYSQTSRKPMIQLGGKYCTTFSESEVATKLVRLIKLFK
jgi:hypothetical protein